MDTGGNNIMSMTPKEVKKSMVVDEETRSERDHQKHYQALDDYFITSGYVFDDLMMFRIDAYSFDVEHLHLPQVRFTIHPRGPQGLSGPKFHLVCEKLKISFVRAVEEDGDIFVRVRGVCNIDVAADLKKLIEDYEDEGTTKPPEGE